MMIGLAVHQAYDRSTREEIDEIGVRNAIKGCFKRCILEVALEGGSCS